MRDGQGDRPHPGPRPSPRTAALCRGWGGTVTPPPSLESFHRGPFPLGQCLPSGLCSQREAGAGRGARIVTQRPIHAKQRPQQWASRATRNERPTGSSTAGRARPGAGQTQAAGGPDRHPVSGGRRNPGCLHGGGLGTERWPRAPGMTELCLPFASSLPLPFPPTKGANTEEKIKKINAHTLLSVLIYGQLHGVGGRKT